MTGAVKAAGDAVEAFAKQTGCERHLPVFRACKWLGDAPCACAAAVRDARQAVPNPSEIFAGG